MATQNGVDYILLFLTSWERLPPACYLYFECPGHILYMMIYFPMFKYHNGGDDDDRQILYQSFCFESYYLITQLPEGNLDLKSRIVYKLTILVLHPFSFYDFFFNLYQCMILEHE